MKITYSLKNLSFRSFINSVIIQYKKVVITFGFLTILPLLADHSWFMIRSILKFHSIFFGGLFLSYVLHEYLHLVILKNSHRDGRVEIEFTLWRISIYPQFKLSAKEMIKVAILPIVVLPIVGVILILFGKFFGQTFLIMTGLLYVFHVINIVPPFSDGMMIIKAIVSKNSQEGREEENDFS